jgi:flavin-dependent dehydrogenase
MRSRDRYDVIIVGGGPAGISAALYLGHFAPRARVAVLEKERFPREKYCAGAIGARGDRLLARIGVAVSVPSAPVGALSIAFAGGDTMTVCEADLGRVVRRLEFDHALAKVAVARGIELREGTPVRALACERDGVRVLLAGGVELAADAVVGADGVAGVVRRAAGFSRGHHRAQVVEVDTEATAGDPDPQALHFDLSHHDLPGYAWDFPTVVDGRRMVCRGVYRIGSDGAPVREYLANHLAQRGLKLLRYRVKQYAERGFVPGEPLACARVVLIGEAAGIDIATGEGIPEALAYGELVAQYLVTALRRREFGFADWTGVVAASRLGRRLALGHRAARWFFGGERAAAERLIRSAPELVRIGCRDFGGIPIGAALWALGLFRIAPLLLRRGSRLLPKGGMAPHQGS